ncbi:MAG: ATP-binding protein [Rubrivivax sp.]|nr:ATP-binding protein [Rubrivivax sp.]
MSIGAEPAQAPAAAPAARRRGSRPPPAAAADPRRANAAALEGELAWFEAVLQARLASYFSQAGAAPSPPALAPPDLTADASEYAQLLRELAITPPERLVLLLALVPHLRPQLLDTLFVRNKNLDRGFTEFGGCKGKAHGGFLPTCETAAFLLAGNDLAQRLEAARTFAPEHAFRQRGLMRIEHDTPGEPAFSAALLPTTELLERVTSGERHKPDYSLGFPAKLITTQLGWSDLVLGDEVLGEVDTITTWITHGRALLADWGLQQAVKPGYRSLFHGPPGTGKTLTATLIGQKARADVYRIDLSMVVSKYIGETEKNLANVFDQAQNRDWILFFDEADALFGKRTATSSSNDRHANQEVSYLLQRVEDFPGTVILATNLKTNIDEAFARRFQSMVYFPMPDADQRLQLWRGMLARPERLAGDVDLAHIAEAHEISGGAIANVVRHGAISALRAGRSVIVAADLLRGIGRELRKEGRTA